MEIIVIFILFLQTQYITLPNQQQHFWLPHFSACLKLYVNSTLTAFLILQFAFCPFKVVLHISANKLKLNFLGAYCQKTTSSYKLFSKLKNTFNAIIHYFPKWQFCSKVLDSLIAWVLKFDLQHHLMVLVTKSGFSLLIQFLSKRTTKAVNNMVD